jgi:hypothetical protein
MVQSGQPTGCPFFLEFQVDLNLVHLIFKLPSDDPVSLMLHLYDAVRRFDKYFKSVCCSQSVLSCHLCREHTERCPHRSVFGQTLSTDPDVLRRHQKPPLPFIFKIGDIGPVNSCVELGLVIVGNAIQHVNIFESAINMMIASIAENNGLDVSVSGTFCLDYQGGRHELNAASHSLVLLSSLEILEATQHSDLVRIHLDSPLRLLCGGTISHSFDFSLLLRSQLRRCSSLFAYYSEGELELDYVYMSLAAAKVTSAGSDFRFTRPDWSRRAGFAGILGAGEFTNLADGMLPLLTLGSHFNAGKGAAYGMGEYRLERV